MFALAAFTGAATGSGSKPPTAVMAASLLKGIACGSAKADSSCPAHDQTVAGDKQAEKIVVPKGSAQCPNSGAGAACGQLVAAAHPGSSALPSGLDACPAAADKPVLSAPGACSDPAAESVAGLAGGAPLRVVPDDPTISLSVDHSVLAAGSIALLQAQSSVSVTGTPWAIEIFDTTSRLLVGACTQSSVCTVAYTGGIGSRSFVAYVMTPGPKMPVGSAAATSNRIETRWLGVTLAVADQPIVAPGKPITFSALASEDVGKIGYRIELRDAASRQQLTFCSQGTTCSTSLIEPVAVRRAVLAQLVPQAPAGHPTSVVLNPTSDAVSGTWLGINVVSRISGGVLSLTATANADLSQTPWSIYLQNEAGNQIGQPCNASTCSANLTVSANDKSRYRAVIGRLVAAAAAQIPPTIAARTLPAAQSRLDVQASSALVQPAHLLWGVDSCQPLTGDSGGATGLLPQVNYFFGMPDFWGRYLPSTTYCPALSAAEIAAAHKYHVGILPIYNDYDCSAVAGYPAGASYAEKAAAIASADGIPSGTGIAIDIEPPGDACPGAGNVDTGFIQGWYDVIVHYNYVPVYYGNSTVGSPFANAWCTAVGTRPEIANSSFIWSFEPSLEGGRVKSTAPAFSPNPSGCAGYTIAWQYQLSAGSAVDVDADEANSVFPFWWP